MEEHRGINFAARLNPEGWAAHAAAQQVRKAPMPPRALGHLKRFAEGGPLSEGSTFTHIVNFFKGAPDGGRLEVACADFGYSIAELRALAGAGKTAQDVATEIIARS